MLFPTSASSFGRARLARLLSIAGLRSGGSGTSPPACAECGTPILLEDHAVVDHDVAYHPGCALLRGRRS